MIRNLGFKGVHKKKLNLTGEINKKINENPNLPIEDILSDETLLDEIESKNELLYNYLNKERIKQMVNYIIKEPPSDSSYDKGHKFPWICSQIFNIEDRNILKYFYQTNNELEIKTEENENNNRDIKNSKNIEMLDYLLSFLNTDSELNYVLCGYFSSLIKNLLNLEYNIIIQYLYLEKKESIQKMIYHSYRCCISEILEKILQYNKDEINENELIPKIRMELLEELFEKIDIDMDTEKLFSLSTFITNLSKDEELFGEILKNKKIIKSLVYNPLNHINLLMDDKNKEDIILNRRTNFITLTDTIMSWVYSIIHDDMIMPTLSTECFKNKRIIKVIHTLLSYELFNVLVNLIKNNFNRTIENSGEKKILQSFDEKMLSPLGLYRIKIVELLGNLFLYFKNISTLYDKLLIECEFFENAFIYLFDYEFNNLYQDALLSLLKTFLNYSDDHDILADHLFNQMKLTYIIIYYLNDEEMKDEDKITDKNKFKYKSGNTANRGYIPFLLSLSYKLNTIVGGEPLKINNTLSREGSMTFVTRATPFVGKEEIDSFYGMDSNDLYEEVDEEIEKKEPKFNTPVESMEKYLDDKWKEFFKDKIADKIKLYEAKLYKEDSKHVRRTSCFRNPFVVEENSDINERNPYIMRQIEVECESESESESGSGSEEDENEDILEKNRKKLNKEIDYEKILYEAPDDNDIDVDMDINMNNNIFKMSMRSAFKNDNFIGREKEKEEEKKQEQEKEKEQVQEQEQEQEQLHEQVHEQEHEQVQEQEKEKEKEKDLEQEQNRDSKRESMRDSKRESMRNSNKESKRESMRDSKREIMRNSKKESNRRSMRNIKRESNRESMKNSKKENKRRSMIEMRRYSKTRGSKPRGNKPRRSRARISIPKICVDEVQLFEEQYSDNNFWNYKRKDSDYIKKLGEEALKDLE